MSFPKGLSPWKDFDVLSASDAGMAGFCLVISGIARRIAFEKIMAPIVVVQDIQISQVLKVLVTLETQMT